MVGDFSLIFFWLLFLCLLSGWIFELGVAKERVLLFYNFNADVGSCAFFFVSLHKQNKIYGVYFNTKSCFSFVLFCGISCWLEGSTEREALGRSYRDEYGCDEGGSV